MEAFRGPDEGRNSLAVARANLRAMASRATNIRIRGRTGTGQINTDIPRSTRVDPLENDDASFVAYTDSRLGVFKRRQFLLPKFVLFFSKQPSKISTFRNCVIKKYVICLVQGLLIIITRENFLAVWNNISYTTREFYTHLYILTGKFLSYKTHQTLKSTIVYHMFHNHISEKEWLQSSYQNFVLKKYIFLQDLDSVVYM